VVAGPYDYTLHRSSIDAINNQAWFLRSTVDCKQPGAPSPPCPEAGPGPGPSPSPPNFRVETSLYAAIPALALLHGRNLLDTLHERVGEEEDLRGRPAASQMGFWSRFLAVHGQQEGDPLGIFGSGPRFQYDFYGFQVGQDLYRREQRDGSRDHAGVYFALGTARSDVTHFDMTGGNSNFVAYSLGGYWTHFGPTGWYIDAIAQGTFYDVTSSANRGIPALTTTGSGFAGSLEGGYPFKLGGGYFVEPQAQLVYQNAWLNNAQDIGAAIHFEDVNSLAGRLGVRMGRTWALDAGPAPQMVTVWIRPNVWHEFRGNPVTSFSSADGFIPFRADIGGTALELNAGVSAQIRQGATLYANFSYLHGVDREDFAYQGKIGFRGTW
jgi:outer membrane autotransporter protein